MLNGLLERNRAWDQEKRVQQTCPGAKRTEKSLRPGAAMDNERLEIFRRNVSRSVLGVPPQVACNPDLEPFMADEYRDPLRHHAGARAWRAPRRWDRAGEWRRRCAREPR